jgi:hypothetical protein
VIPFDSPIAVRSFSVTFAWRQVLGSTARRRDCLRNPANFQLGEVVQFHTAWSHRSLHVLDKKPDLQFVGADDIGNNDVIGSHIVFGGGVSGHCPGFFQDDFVGLK